jgi:hypothetical protein
VLLLLLVCGVLLGLMHAAPGDRPPKPVLSVAARTAVLEEGPDHVPAGDSQQPSRHPLDEHRTGDRKE